ncbi:protein induced by osmotic stress [Scheffersomyces xylosifermentans]|uniref:protein induced by osmotic stress n=1 Tax=Scheffersomyces xylosifermentans TaxID=1304137 RepID=UPI00315DE4E9
MTSTSVFISGANGFLAQHIITQLISLDYNVVGSVRTLEKGKKLKELYGQRFQYEVVPIIEVEGAFDNALLKHPEVTLLMHTASPVTFTAKDLQREIIIPAVVGTQSILNSIMKVAPGIERVVFTSSYCAIASHELQRGPHFTGGEKFWNDITYEQSIKDPLSAYAGSKTFAEKAAWAFIKKQKPRFSLTSINPVFIFGPQARSEEIKETMNLSAEIVNTILRLKPDDPVPDVEGIFVDVRDVAKAHIFALDNDNARSKRLILATARFNGHTILNTIRDHFPQLRDQLPLPNQSALSLSAYAEINDRESRDILGFDHISFADSIADAVAQILQVYG